MYARRRQRRRGWIVGCVALVAVAILAYFFWPWKSDGEPSDAGTLTDTRLAANTNTDEESRDQPISSNTGSNRGTAGNGNNADTSARNHPAGSDSLLPRGQDDPSQQRQQVQSPKQYNVVITMGEPLDKVKDDPAGPDSNAGGTAANDPPPPPQPGTTANTSENGGQSPNLPGPIVPASAPTELSQLLTQAEELAARNELVRARELYNQALYHPRVGQAAPAIRRIMAGINDTLIFSKIALDTDPYTDTHVVANGELLGSIANRCRVEWRFLARINGIADPSKIQAGQSIKIVHGPFHAVVDKSEYRMDIYIGEPNELGQQMFVRSFPIGLGEFGSTPIGEWVVRKGSKLINPTWRNPRTGEFFGADDPDNPIGERWIGIRGIDENTELLSGYGIHGTIDPDSIGKDMSMGCIRMLPDDVIHVYEMLTEERSLVWIRD